MANELAGTVEGPQLLATKLHIPTPRMRLVDRSRIWERLDAAAAGPLTVVSGPAGSGKTVAVATWIDVRVGADRSAWVSLEDSENDAVLFWFYVIEALRRVDAEIGARSRRLVSAIARDPAQVLLPLLEDLEGRAEPIILVLDDYHVIENIQVHDSLAFLLDHLPSTTHLVLTSRSEPPLGLGTRRVRGELAELGAAELRFSVSDAAEMMLGLGVDLDRAQIEGLTRQTEGWAAGLYLAGLSLRDNATPDTFVGEFAGTDRHIVDFLASEILDGLGADVRTFLRRTSVLSNLSAGLCDAVVGVPGSQQILEQLERSNLFLVPLDNNRRWYRYHHLFADLLAFDLAQVEPDLIPHLHGCAGEWYLQNDENGPAITHLIAATRYDEAADLVLKIAVRYFNTGRWHTVERWVNALPQSLVISKPPLALSMAWALFAGGLLEAVLPWVVRAEAGDTSVMTPWADGLDVATEAQLLRSFTSRAHGDFAGALLAGEQACELVAENLAPRRFVAYVALGISQYWTGDSDAARTNLNAALDDLRHDRDRRATAELLCLGVLAALDLDDGNLEEAQRRTAEARELIIEQHLTGSNLAAMTLVAEGRVALRSGDLESAQRSLDHGLAMALSAADPGPSVSALRALSELHHREGDPNRARARLNDALELLDGTDASILAERVRHEKEALRRPWVGASLTDRELDLLRLLPSNLSRREIGVKLHVSPETIKTHSRSLYRKLGVTTRRECVEHARDHGLI